MGISYAGRLPSTNTSGLLEDQVFLASWEAMAIDIALWACLGVALASLDLTVRNAASGAKPPKAFRSHFETITGRCVLTRFSVAESAPFYSAPSAANPRGTKSSSRWAAYDVSMFFVLRYANMSMMHPRP